MSNLILEGFPQNTKLQRLVFLFKQTLRKSNIENFWIKDMSDIRRSDLKSITIEFPSYEDAEASRRILNGFRYRDGQKLYPIKAYMVGGRPRRRSPSPKFMGGGGYNMERYEGNYSRVRSRSPHLREETSKLDLEIELLKKQRLIIEEERRLLLERKKLEMVKEFGPRALQDFEMSHGRERYRPREFSPRRRSPPLRRRPQKPDGVKGPQANKFPVQSKKLPNFVWPVKIIMKDMKTFMDKAGLEDREASMLFKMVRINLRKRLAVLVEGKPMMSGPDLAALYRERYPSSTDEITVQKLVKDVKGLCLSAKKDGKGKKDGENANGKGKTDQDEASTVKDASAGEGVKEEDIEMKEETKETEKNDKVATVINADDDKTTDLKDSNTDAQQNKQESQADNIEKTENVTVEDSTVINVNEKALEVSEKIAETTDKSEAEITKEITKEPAAKVTKDITEVAAVKITEKPAAKITKGAAKMITGKPAAKITVKATEKLIEKPAEKIPEKAANNITEEAAKENTKNSTDKGVDDTNSMDSMDILDESHTELLNETHTDDWVEGEIDWN